jgi:hypothetical protein
MTIQILRPMFSASHFPIFTSWWKNAVHACWLPEDKKCQLREKIFTPCLEVQ